jgi:hypothetical protein
MSKGMIVAAQRLVFSRPLREYGIDTSRPAFKMSSTSKSERSAAGRLEHGVGPPAFPTPTGGMTVAHSSVRLSLTGVHLRGLLRP